MDIKVKIPERNCITCGKKHSDGPTDECSECWLADLISSPEWIEYCAIQEWNPVKKLGKVPDKVEHSVPGNNYRRRRRNRNSPAKKRIKKEVTLHNS